LSVFTFSASAATENFNTLLLSVKNDLTGKVYPPPLSYAIYSTQDTYYTESAVEERKQCL
jgi:hypothetical protein